MSTHSRTSGKGKSDKGSARGLHNNVPYTKLLCAALLRRAKLDPL